MSTQEKPSREFMNAVCNNGTTAADCDMCKRTHYAGGSLSDLTDEELASYAEKAKAEPDKYCFTSDDSVSFGFIDGLQVVFDCPCNGMRRYEDWIWNHRELIVDYLKARTKSDLAQAQYNAGRLTDVRT